MAASAVLLRWRELWQVEELELGISDNKAVFPSRYLTWSLTSGVRVAAKRLCGGLPWWEVRWRRQAEGAFFNKLVGALLLGGLLSFSLPGRRGVGRDGDEKHACASSGLAALWEGGVRPQARSGDCGASRRSSSTAATCGRRYLRPWRPSALGDVQPEHLLPPRRRIFIDLGLGIIVGVAPSGKLPGGGASAWTSRSTATRCSGEDDQGPDCFSIFSSRVLYVIREDCFRTCANVRVLCVNLYPLVD